KMDIVAHELTADVIYQIAALQGLAKVADTRVSYVKPHGALYNTIGNDEYQAIAVIEGILAIDPNLILVGLAGSNILRLARERGLKTIA
ncbi:LamB/YcsF family protein, partial [Xenorhabdus bovienii]|uniref:LamB/YcsF family protein n=1 Tax=Xenorhabdus bovienii TaxID=40576 RepID=UPI0023B24E71